MNIILTTGSYAQFITVLVMFVLVLGVTAFVTRWMANYQKTQNANCNIEIIETTRITNSKYIQLVRIGETYMAIAVCKDTVTMLGEVPAEQLRHSIDRGDRTSFRELFEKTLGKNSSGQSESKDNDNEET